MIALFLAPIYLLFQWYILLWLFAWTNSMSHSFRSLWFRLPAALIYLFFALSPLVGFLVTKEPFHHALRVIGNYWLGVLQYILLFVLLFDLIRRITGHSFFIKYRYPALLHTMPKNLVIFGGLVVFLVISLSVYGVIHAKQIRVRHYPVTIEKSSDLPGLKIALAADLHLGYNATKDHVQKLVDLINQEQPDLICIAGDIFDNEYDAIKDPDAIAEILSGLESRYGVYACYGNHDITEALLAGFTFSPKELPLRDPRIEEFLKKADITMLEDETILIDNAFYLGGRRDSYMARKEGISRKTFSELTKDLNPDFPIIIMDHQPKELSEAAASGVDLDLSGHTHDGQVFPANLIVRMVWENPLGAAKIENMTSVVTSGAGVWGPAMRIGTDNEIAMINVTFTAP